MNAWAEKFQHSNLVKGEKAAFSSVLLCQSDKRLLDLAAEKAGLKSSILAARIVSQVLRTNRHRFED